jgi:glutamate carboxypeptidase
MPLTAGLRLGDAVVDVAKRVAAEAENDLELILADLAAWVDCDSPSSDPGGLEQVARLIAGRMDVYGATVELVPRDGAPALAASARGRGRSRIALLCHHDTVFAPGAAAERPFSRSGRLAYGPGVADMKGGIAVAAHVLRLVSQSHPDAFGHLKLLSVPDEEIRTVPFAGIDALKGFDAVFCMECGRPGDGIVTARKGGHWLSATSSGRAAHAGVAARDGRSALLAACQEALRIARLDGQRDGLGVNVTELHAGEGLNSVAASATMTVDVRGWHDEDLVWALAEIGRFGTYDGIGFSVATSGRVPPMERTGPVVHLARLARTIGEALGLELHEVATGGVSDACWTAAAGIPTLDGLGPIGAHDHSPDEVIEVSSIAGRCGLLAGLIAAVEKESPGGGKPSINEVNNDEAA